MIKDSLTKKQFVEQVAEYCYLRPWWYVQIACERIARFYAYADETPKRYIWFEYDRMNQKVNITTEINGNFVMQRYTLLIVSALMVMVLLLMLAALSRMG